MRFRGVVARRAFASCVGAAAIALTIAATAPAVGASDSHGSRDQRDHREHHEQRGGYTQTNLISDQAGMAKMMDPNLVNPWGIASGPTTPFWVSDNGMDISSIFAGAVHGSPIMQPRPPVNVFGGAPTGQFFNTTSQFVVHSGNTSAPAIFVFASENGSISGWNPNVDPNNSVLGVTTPNAVYKGITMSQTEDGLRLYAANFHTGAVDVFDGNFMPVNRPHRFVDSHLPTGFAPFNVAAIGHDIFVTYAKQDAAAHDDVKGPGNGFVDEYTNEGRLEHRFATRGALNSPWAVVVAPRSFGRFGGDILIGNFGDGRINAFDGRGDFLGPLRDTHGQPISIDGLWGLRFGNGTFSTPGTLVFTAGPQEESHGLLGTLTPNDH